MVRHVLFVLALAAQLGILAYAPVGKTLIYKNGRVVTLRTRPVDPYDVLRGYHVILDFEIAEPPRLEEAAIGRGEPIYTVLAENDEGVWNALRCGKEFFGHLEEGEVVIRGRGDRRGRSIVYGIEKYFVPEAERAAIEEAVRGEEERILVDVAVDSDGVAAILRLRVGDAVFDY